MNKEQLTDEERKHHKLLLSTGEGTYSRLMTNIINAKTRLVNIVTMDLVILSIILSVCLYLFNNGWKYYEICLVASSIGLLILSLFFSLMGLIRKTRSWEIISTNEEDFEEYMELDEKGLFKDFLENLKKGLSKDKKAYQDIVTLFDYALGSFVIAVIIFIFFIMEQIWR